MNESYVKISIKKYEEMRDEIKKLEIVIDGKDELLESSATNVLIKYSSYNMEFVESADETFDRMKKVLAEIKRMKSASFIDRLFGWW